MPSVAHAGRSVPLRPSGPGLPTYCVMARLFVVNNFTRLVGQYISRRSVALRYMSQATDVNNHAFAMQRSNVCLLIVHIARFSS